MTTKTVLITGAARGIGAQTARVLAGHGWNVALVGLEPAELAAVAEGIGPQAAWYEADVTNQQQLDWAVQGAVERFGGLDAVVANAGIASFGNVRTTDPAAWAKTIDINVTGAFRTVRAALPTVIERRGYILIVASVASFTPVAGMSAYSASKAGAESLASSLAAEVAGYGVKVGSAHPSWIDTDMVRDAESDLPSFRALRGKLPWPVHSTTSLEACAEAIADGVVKRKRRVYVPRSVALLYWGRALLQSGAATAVMARVAKPLIPQMDEEVAALGRSVSERAARNALPNASPATP